MSLYLLRGKDWSVYVEAGGLREALATFDADDRRDFEEQGDNEVGWEPHEIEGVDLIDDGVVIRARP